MKVRYLFPLCCNHILIHLKCIILLQKLLTHAAASSNNAVITSSIFMNQTLIGLFVMEGNF